MQKRISLTYVWGILLIGAATLSAQNSTNSPYTRYGYGDLANRSFGAGRSMGGIGIGLRSSKQINPMNPASYSSMDSLTFLFDFGASFQMSWYKDGINKQNDFNGNVEYIAMQFPLIKRMAMSVGLLPYSHVGYAFEDIKLSDDGLYYREVFEGTGGLNQLYAGLSIELWKKRLSVGSNINYLFGSITHSSNTEYVSSSTTQVIGSNMLKVNDVTFDFGLQYTQPLTKTDKLVAGMTFTPKKRLKNETTETLNNSSEVIVSNTFTNRAYDAPAGYGLGLSYVRENKFLAAADLSFQEWKKAAYNGETNVFNNRPKVNAGFEFIPNLYSRPYVNRIRYRAGLSYTNSYILVNGYGTKEYGATVGAGFPISDARSFVNFSLEYVKVSPNLKTMIKENYFRMTLSYTFNEYWFFKTRVD